MAVLTRAECIPWRGAACWECGGGGALGVNPPGPGTGPPPLPPLTFRFVWCEFVKLGGPPLHTPRLGGYYRQRSMIFLSVKAPTDARFVLESNFRITDLLALLGGGFPSFLCLLFCLAVIAIGDEEEKC